jgi:hypothetical protein
MQKYTLTKVVYSFEKILSYISSVRSASIASTSHHHKFAILLLMIVGYEKLRGWDSFQWHNVHTKFRENRYCLSVEMGHTHIHIHTQYDYILNLLVFPFFKLGIAR